MSSLGKRGPLKKEGAVSKTYYNCKVCEKRIRGDELRAHYLSKVNFNILNEAKTLPKLSALSKINSIDDTDKQKHTKYFYEQKYFSRDDIPSYKHHKRPVQNVETPFDMCKKNKGSDSPNLPSTSDGNLETETFHNTEFNAFNEATQSIEATAPAEPFPQAEPTPHDDATPPPIEQTLPTIVENVETDAHFDLGATVEDPIQESIGLQPSSVLTNIKGEVLSAVADVLNGSVLNSEVNEFIDDLTEKISFKLKNLSDPKSSTQAKSDWLSTETHFICKSCSKFAKSDEVPQKMKHFYRGDFGFVEKGDPKHHNFCKKRHESTELHLWCLEQQAKSDIQSADAEDKSRKAGMLVIRNALFCFKKGLSSRDFVALNDKDNMTELTTATKNDSKIQFYDIRNLADEKLSHQIKMIFKDVKAFSVTLDKVTVGRISYTVVLSYFFYDGRIHVVLNKLVHLSSKDYDGPGTAKMLLDCLVETTGLTESQISLRLVHLIYDGVYSEQYERIRGGGSLSLRTNLETKLGLQKGAITGTWDAAHLMQIVFGEVFKAHPKVKKLMEIFFDAMKRYHIGKAATLFAEQADELGYSVVSNKQIQTTRFVASYIRGGSSSLRNLPTTLAMMENDIKKALAEKDNTEAKVLTKLRDDLNNGYNLAFIIGVLQILEKYAEASLAAQHCFHFPTMIWKSINSIKADIEKLGEKWEWGKTPLKISGIGTPEKHIQNLKEGKFVPHIPKKSDHKKSSPTDNTSIGKTASPELIVIDEDEEDDEEIRLIESSENLVIESEVEISNFSKDDDCGSAKNDGNKGAGQFAVLSDWSENESKLKQTLQNMCNSLSHSWNERQSENSYEKTIIDAFGDPHDIVKLPYNEQFEYLYNKTQGVLSEMPPNQAEQFDCTLATAGFVSWNQFFYTRKKQPINIVYKEWIKSLSNDTRRDYSQFIQLFENIQIRGMSEAICETAGSVMVNHASRGRNLLPKYFSVELRLRFNLGPLHKLDPLCNQILDAKPKLYHRKLDNSRSDKLVSVHSAAVSSYRKQEEDKSKLPSNFWG